MKTKTPNTLQSKLGFADEDLKKSSHDKMMLWLDRNIQGILDNRFTGEFSDADMDLLNRDGLERLKKVLIDRTKVLTYYIERADYYDSKTGLNEWEKQKLDEYNSKINEENRKLEIITNWRQFKTKPSRPKTTILKKIWELPVTTQGQYSSGTSSKYTVGFVDMAVQFQIPRPHISGLVSEKNPEITGNSIEWLDDIKQEIEIDFNPITTWLYLEVKTEIRSLGELVRQINHYKEYLPGQYCVVCPGYQYTDILQSQGIDVIEYPAA